METRHQLRKEEEAAENRLRMQREAKRVEMLFQRNDNVIRRNDIVTDTVLRKIKVEQECGEKIVKVKMEDCEEAEQPIVKEEYEEMEEVVVKEEELGMHQNGNKERTKKSVRRDDSVTGSPMPKMVKVERDFGDGVKQEEVEEKGMHITSSFSLNGDKTDSDSSSVEGSVMKTENASTQASNSSHGDGTASDLATEEEENDLDYEALKRSHNSLTTQLAEKEEILAAQPEKISKLDGDIGVLRDVVRMLTEISWEDAVIVEFQGRIHDLEKEKENVETLERQIKLEMSRLERRIAEIKSAMDTKEKAYKEQREKPLGPNNGSATVWSAEVAYSEDGKPVFTVKPAANGQKFNPKRGDFVEFLGTERPKLDKVIGIERDENGVLMALCKWKPSSFKLDCFDEEAKSRMRRQFQ